MLLGFNACSYGVHEGQWVLLGGAEACFASHILFFVHVFVVQKGTPGWYNGNGVLSMDLQHSSFCHNLHFSPPL